MRIAIFRKSILTIIFFVNIVAFTGCDRQQDEEKQITVVFRYDDYSALSSTNLELRIINAFRSMDASITFGVIPFVCKGDVIDPSPQDVVPMTSMKGDILKTAFKDEILEIALHGYSHQTINTKQGTEFSGLDYISQVERLSKGKKLLEGITGAPVTTFIPPWNRYDLNTLLALKELAFSTLSAERGGEITKESLLNFLPVTCSLLQLRDAVKAARSSSDTQPVIVVLFHEYEFQDINEKSGNITFQEFSDLLKWLNSERDVRLKSFTQAASLINDLSASRYLANNRINSISSLVPPSLRSNALYVYCTLDAILFT